MRLLADENFPAAAVDLLRRQGHDVLWGRTAMPGAPDEEVIGRAVAEQRVLLTFDKDFGDLMFRMRLPASCGVVLFRIAPTSPARVAKLAVDALESRPGWTGFFSVIEEDRLRMRPLPE